MAIAKTKHFVYLPTVIDAKIEVMEPDIYNDIADVVGVYTPTLIYNASLRLTTNELRRNGVVVQISCRTESGKSHKIICSVEKLSTALPGLVGKSIPEQNGANVNSAKITKASIARKRSRL